MEEPSSLRGVRVDGRADHGTELRDVSMSKAVTKTELVDLTDSLWSAVAAAKSTLYQVERERARKWAMDLPGKTR